REQALGLWRTALGLKEDLVLASELEAAKSEAQRQIDSLVAQLEEQNIQTGRLQRNLEEVRSTLAEQSRSLQVEQSEARRLEQQVTTSRAAGDIARVQELEAQLAAAEARAEEQEIAIELLQADVAVQQAQVKASMRRANVRGKQLAKAQASLLAESSRGAALLRQLKEKDLALAALEQQAADAQAQLARSRNKQEQLSSKVAAASGANKAALEKELAQALADVQQRERQMQQLENQAAQQRAAYDAQLAESRIREADLNTELAKSQAEKKQLAAKLSQTNGKLDKLEKDLTDARYKLADRQAATANLRDQLAGIGTGNTAEREALNRKIAEQEQAIAALQQERDKLVAGWEEMERERDLVRGELTDEVDTTSWLNVELESASSKMAGLREELKAAELALADANFAKTRLTSDVARLEEDLARSTQRSAADRRLMEQQLNKMREQLADASNGVARARTVALRTESDFERYGERQKSRAVALSQASPDVASITQIPKGAPRVRYKAVIIANYDYDYLPDLSSPPNDANQLKKVLEQNYNFNVKVHINLSRSEMYKVLAQLREFDEKDSVLLYYVGHGKMDEFGDGYWLPTDYNTSRPLADAISSSDLTQTMSQSEARHFMVMADSCYSGALARNGDPTLAKSIPALLNYWMANKSRTVLTSGGLKPVLREGPDNHSIFATALMEVLRANGGAINGEMLHAQLYNRVRQSAAAAGFLDQKPQFAAVEDAGHENGQFVFLKPDTVRL
ncbi:MAG: hypothetical protein HKN19_08930, partial [Halioglobus sp.]|nr:hypothetical protein [Halioglobus sp.]